MAERRLELTHSNQELAGHGQLYLESGSSLPNRTQTRNQRTGSVQSCGEDGSKLPLPSIKENVPSEESPRKSSTRKWTKTLSSKFGRRTKPIAIEGTSDALESNSSSNRKKSKEKSEELSSSRKMSSEEGGSRKNTGKQQCFGIVRNLLKKDRKNKSDASPAKLSVLPGPSIEREGAYKGEGEVEWCDLDVLFGPPVPANLLSQVPPRHPSLSRGGEFFRDGAFYHPDFSVQVSIPPGNRSGGSNNLAGYPHFRYATVPSDSDVRERADSRERGDSWERGRDSVVPPHPNFSTSSSSLSSSFIDKSLPAPFPCYPHPSPSPLALTIHTRVDYAHFLVPRLLQISSCPFYWGVIDRYEAELRLEGRPEGAFLLRDSAQEEFLFSVSFRRYGRSLHARIEQSNHRFSFDSHDPAVFCSPTIRGLVERYKDPSCCMFFEPMLTTPLNRNYPFSLQHLCRAVVCDSVTYDAVAKLAIPARIKEYLRYYHYKQKVGQRTFDEEENYDENYGSTNGRRCEMRDAGKRSEA